MSKYMISKETKEMRHMSQEEMNYKAKKWSNLVTLLKSATHGAQIAQCPTAGDGEARIR